MVKLNSLTVDQRYQAVRDIRVDTENIALCCRKMESDYIDHRIKVLVLKYYDIPSVEHIYQIFGGTVNRNYAIEDVNKKLYFLRQYVANKEEKEILYEHHLLQHIRNQGFTMNSLPLSTCEGTTYFREEMDGQQHYFALSEFLEGEETYQWERNEVTTKACISAAQTVAKFHSAVESYNPPPHWGNNEPIIKIQLEYYSRNIRNCIKILSQDPSNLLFVQYLESKIDYLDDVTSRLLKIFDQDDQLVKTVIHTDLHPGNFKYVDDNVVSLFDFDWPKKDVRLYETAICTMFFTSSWRSEKNGEIDLDLMAAWIKSYDEEMRRMGSNIGPMNETELKYFPEMMMIGSLYPTHFCVQKCVNEPNINIFEYFYYTMHQIRCVEWIDQNIEQVRKITTSLYNQ